MLGTRIAATSGMGPGRVFNSLGTAVLGLPSWSSNVASGHPYIRTRAVPEN